MAYNDKARRYAADMLEHRRHAAAMETDRRRAKILSQIPELRELELAIAATGLSLVRNSLVNEQDENLAASVQIQIEVLRSKERHILQEHNLAPDYLDPIHHCSMCKDSGITDDGTTCDCASQLLREYTMREVNRVSPLALCDFGTFSLDYYDTAVDDEYGMSPRENMRQNLNVCVKFANDFPKQDENLLMLGDAGLGKTHLALSVANAVLSRGHNVVYCSAANIFKQMEIEHFENGRDTTTLVSLKRCDLLVLDDLGAEFISPFASALLYDIVNTRILQHRPTIYTSNITKEEVLTMRYGEKVMSRLVGCSTVLPFFGEDIRIQKSNEQEPAYT